MTSDGEGLTSGPGNRRLVKIRRRRRMWWWDFARHFTGKWKGLVIADLLLKDVVCRGNVVVFKLLSWRHEGATGGGGRSG